jgi:hypothetical protein
MENTDVDQAAEGDPAAEPASAPTPARRWQIPVAVVVVIVAVTAGALVARAWVDDDRPESVRMAQTDCEQWAESMPSAHRPDAGWCREAAGWMGAPMAGSGAMMAGNATDVEGVCRSRMASVSTDAPEWCAEMARRLAESHGGPMMGGSGR